MPHGIHYLEELIRYPDLIIRKTPYEFHKELINCLLLNYLIISLTVPAPTVLPPSRIENLVPFSTATG